MSKEFSFDELDKAMTKVDSLGSKMTENSFSRIDEWIHTGNYLLNAQISGSIFKGVPNSRSVGFSGKTSTGKSFLVLNLTREAQKAGYHVIYGDSEAAVDEQTMINFGIDPEKVRYQPLKTVLQTRHFIANLCATLREKKNSGFKIPKIAMVIDSLGNLATEKETADAMSGSDKRDMTKQQNLKSMFRIITTDLAELKIPLWVTNHVYDAVGSYFPTTVQAGGSALQYCASIIVEFVKAGLKDGDEEASEQGQTKSGIIVTSKVVKSRFAKPIPIKFHISFYKGMNPYVGLENYVSWNTCGIERGTYEEEIIEKPIYEADGITQKVSRGKPRFEKVHTGKYVFIPDSKSKTWAVKHLNKAVKNIFTPEVFTREVLEKLDDVIRQIFEFSKNVTDQDELNGVLGIDADTDTNTQNDTIDNIVAKQASDFDLSEDIGSMPHFQS